MGLSPLCDSLQTDPLELDGLFLGGSFAAEGGGKGGKRLREGREEREGKGECAFVV